MNDTVTRENDNARAHMQTYEELRGTLVAVTERLKAAEETICNAKRERECVTVEDWKFKAMEYEYQWRGCSEYSNGHAYRAQQAEAEILSAHRVLDDAGVPRNQENGLPYSLVGRLRIMRIERCSSTSEN